MELGFNWREFQEIFYPRKKKLDVLLQNVQSRVEIVKLGDTIFTIRSEGEDLSEWIGESFSAFSLSQKHRPIRAFEADQILKDTQTLLNGNSALIVDQLSELRSKANFVGTRTKGKKEYSVKLKGGSEKRIQFQFEENFFLDSFLGRWARFMPNQYGLFLKLSQREFVVIIRGKEIIAAFEPDFSQISFERRKQPLELVRFLSDRYTVPVFGLFAEEKDWVSWCGSSNPWKKLRKAVATHEAKLLPFHWGMRSIFFLRSWLGI